MKPYEKYKDSGVDGGDHRWIGEIPEHWSKLKIGRTFRKIGSGTTPNTNTEKYYEDGNINWLNTGDLNDSYITSTKKKITQIAIDEISTLKLSSIDSIVIALYGATIGKLGHLKIETTTNQACCVLSESEEIENRYLFYFLMAAKNFIISKAYGGGQPNISQDLIKQLYITAPSQQEQTAIAKYLDHQTAIIDELIEKKTKQIALLKEKRQAIINETITKGLDPTAKMKDSGIEWLGEIPENWEVTKIKFISSVISKGTTPSTEGKGLVDNGIKYLKAENIKDSEVSSIPEFFIDEETHEILKRSQLQENDILFVIAGATIGKVAILPKELTPSNTNQAVSFIRLKEGENYKFIHYWLLSSKIYDQIWFWAVQSAQPNLSMESLGNFPVPYPSIHEQELIVNFLNCKFGEYESVIVNNLNQIEKLKEYRQSLISEAVTGKIDVREWS